MFQTREPSRAATPVGQYGQPSRFATDLPHAAIAFLPFFPESRRRKVLGAQMVSQ
jgi:hypothetical protein